MQTIHRCQIHNDHNTPPLPSAHRKAAVKYEYACIYIYIYYIDLCVLHTCVKYIDVLALVTYLYYIYTLVLEKSECENMLCVYIYLRWKVEGHMKFTSQSC